LDSSSFRKNPLLPNWAKSAIAGQILDNNMDNILLKNGQQTVGSKNEVKMDNNGGE
jgi:hypothetical protein